MEINPSVWAFLGVLLAAVLSYLSNQRKNKAAGASSLVDASVSLLDQYRLAHKECRDELEKCRLKLSDK